MDIGALIATERATMTVDATVMAPASLLDAIVVTATHVTSSAPRDEVRLDCPKLDGRPFALVNHFKMFGYSDGRFTIRFAGPQPEVAAFEQWMAGVAVPTWACLRTHGPFTVEMRCHGASGQHKVRLWRTITSTLLLPLHDRFAIERVTCQ